MYLISICDAKKILLQSHDSLPQITFAVADVGIF